MTDQPPTTTQPPAPSTTGNCSKTLEPAHAYWPGFRFPPPLLGIDPRTLDQAAAAWLCAVADTVRAGDQSLNALFSIGLAEAICDHFELPRVGAQLVPAAGCYALGGMHTGGTGASISTLFATPPIAHITRLRRAADHLDH